MSAFLDLLLANHSLSSSVLSFSVLEQVLTATEAGRPRAFDLSLPPLASSMSRAFLFTRLLSLEFEFVANAGLGAQFADVAFAVSWAGSGVAVPEFQSIFGFPCARGFSVGGQSSLSAEDRTLRVSLSPPIWPMIGMPALYGGPPTLVIACRGPVDVRVGHIVARGTFQCFGSREVVVHTVLPA